ncbi:MAG: DNA-3-methyladenine glycosylase 2 family protein [Chloroflexi bacterium]|nr:DNA-3-methyladenine glycosylase 2 family protein [Chloroflexota bacterium]
MEQISERELQTAVKPSPHFDWAGSLSFLSESGANDDLDHIADGVLTRPIRLAGRVARLRVASAAEAGLLVTLRAPDGEEAPSEAMMHAALDHLKRRFYLDVDMETVRKALAVDAYGEELVGRFWPSRPVNYADAWHALLKSVVHSQIYPGFAAQLDRYLRETYGTAVAFEGETVHLFPTPQQLASADEVTLQEAKFSRQKSKYVVDISRTLLTEAEKYDFEALREGDGQAAVETLADLYGVGPWISQNVAMRGLPHPDVFIDEKATRATIKDAYATGPRFGKKAVQQAVESFAPYRSFACYYTYMKHYNTDR